MCNRPPCGQRNDMRAENRADVQESLTGTEPHDRAGCTANTRGRVHPCRLRADIHRYTWYDTNDSRTENGDDGVDRGYRLPNTQPHNGTGHAAGCGSGVDARGLTADVN